MLGNPGPGSAGQASPTAGPSASPAGPSSTPASQGSTPASQGSAAAGSVLPGLRSDPPPWAPETANLRARLQAIGLPALSAEGTALHTHQHLDIVIDGQPVPVPADVGINETGGFLAEIHTHDATGIIHVESPVLRTFTLGEFFDIWGVQFTSHCIGGSCDGNGRTLAVFVNGTPAAGDPRAIPLESGQEILVALGTAAQLPSPLPSSYPFPQGL